MDGRDHPDLSAAGARLAKEEREYRALDEPVASHAHNKCSISAYLGQKFYEYVSMAETVYKLATDEEFRKQIATALGAAMESGGFLNDFFVMLGAGHGAQERAIAGLANRDIGLANEKLQKAQAEATSRTLSRIQSHFADKWQAFKQGWEECGIAYAVAKAGIDGVFLAGEVVLGGAAIKGVRFSYRLVREGVHRVDIFSVEKGTIGGHSWTTEALESKYGRPDENQVGGLLPDRNREIKTLSPDQYIRLRRRTPSREIRRQTRSEFPDATPERPVADEWLPGLQRTAPVEADHIVSMKEISRMDGFAELSYEDQLEVLNMQENFTGLSRAANGSKGSMTFEEWTHHKRTGTPVDPSLREIFIKKEAALRKKLQEDITARRKKPKKSEPSSQSRFRG